MTTKREAQTFMNNDSSTSTSPNTDSTVGHLLPSITQTKFVSNKNSCHQNAKDSGFPIITPKKCVKKRQIKNNLKMSLILKMDHYWEKDHLVL